MKCRLLMFVLVFILLPVLSFADWSDTDYDTDYDDDTDNVDPAPETLIEETFITDFPPLNWSVVQSNAEKTWEQGLTVNGLGVCAHVEGTQAQSKEYLVTPELICSNCDRVYLDYFEEKIDSGIGDDLQPMISYNFGKTENPTWQAMGDSATVAPNQPFWIAFRYTGSGGPGFNIDDVEIYHYGTMSSDDDVNNPDDDDDDNDNITDPADDDDNDDDGCGCHVSKTKSGFALTFIMLLIGIVALAVSLRVKPTS